MSTRLPVVVHKSYRYCIDDISLHVISRFFLMSAPRDILPSIQLWSIWVAPWGYTSNFPDTSAYWIWNTPNGNSDQPSNTLNVNYNFYRAYYYAGTTSTSVTIYAEVDNSGYMNWNNNFLGNLNGKKRKLGLFPSTQNIMI